MTSRISGYRKGRISSQIWKNKIWVDESVSIYFSPIVVEVEYLAFRFAGISSKISSGASLVNFAALFSLWSVYICSAGMGSVVLPFTFFLFTSQTMISFFIAKWNPRPTCCRRLRRWPAVRCLAWRTGRCRRVSRLRSCGRLCSRTVTRKAGRGAWLLHTVALDAERIELLHLIDWLMDGCQIHVAPASFLATHFFWSRRKFKLQQSSFVFGGTCSDSGEKTNFFIHWEHGQTSSKFIFLNI